VEKTGTAISSDLEAIRSQAPLVHNITNYVVMNTTANALLALGARPVMAHALDEVEEMVGLARALVLNIGTLSGPWIEAMVKAGLEARRRGIPVVLDPVGAGATRMRTEVALRLLTEVSPTIVRGNASEIRALALAEQGTSGVDSTRGAEEALEAARDLSKRWSCTVSVSGATDLIVAGASLARVRNGHPLLARITGSGCTATALTGAFAAVNPSPFHAAAHAMACLGIAGEMAAERAAGPGSMQVGLLDALSALTPADVEMRLRMEGG
jgi:hydroxyethylthiazole kinase